MEEKTTNRPCISFGKCNSKYCFIILKAIIIFLILLLLIFIFFFNYLKTGEKLYNSLNISPLLISLGDSLMFFPGLIFQQKISSKSQSSSLKSSNVLEKYIFNPGTFDLTIKEKIFFVLAAIIKLLMEVIYIAFVFIFSENIGYFQTYLFSFRFELIFIFLLSKYVYKTVFYKHQYYSILILAALSLIKFFVENIFNFINNFFIYLGLFIALLILSFLNSLILVFVKGLMQYKYISPYKTIYSMGFVNFTILAIIYIILTFIPCEANTCQVEYDGKKYIANIFSAFNYSGLILLLGYAVKPFMTLLNYITINEFSVCHSFLILNVSELYTVMSVDDNKIEEIFGDATVAIIQIGFFLINTFLILLFLEMIELNIFNISDNTKQNIEQRALYDKILVDSFNEGNSEDEIEETVPNEEQKKEE